MTSRGPPAILTLVGSGGAGKSTTGNLLLQQPDDACAFLESDSVDACTSALASATSRDGRLTVVDTPAVDGPSGLANLQTIADHLRTAGGVVAVVQTHGALDFHVLQPLAVVAEVLGASFSTSCVLVTTKWPFRRKQSEAELAAAVQAYHTHAQRVVKDHVGRSFAGCYAYNVASEQQQAALVQAVRADVVHGRIKSLRSGEAKPWADVVAEFQRRREREEADFRGKLEDLTDRSNACEELIKWHTTIARPAAVVGAIAGCLTAVVLSKQKSYVWMGGALVAASVGAFVYCEVSLRKLRTEHSVMEQKLWDANRAIDKARRQRLYEW